ncbi:4-carboxymuconolactone decarboxylase, partial [bacterium]|nr:4-carboxymuconolactone decarboxylase [bacterium]
MNYYDSKDLGRFSEVGKFASKLMEKFFAYYIEATGTEG